MKHYSISLFYIILAAFFSCHSVQQATSQVHNESSSLISEATKKKIDSIFKKYDNLETPGLAIGIVKDGETIFTKGYGMASLEYGIPVSDSTVFTLCSVSKQFTVLGLMLMVEQGLVSLDDDIRKYVPELPDYGTTITLRQLANNTSGLRSHLRLLGLKGYIADDMINQKTVEEIIFSQRELNNIPGEAYSYSNSGFVLLAMVVERVSGKPFSSYITENIFRPLKMDKSFIMDNYQRIVKNKAISYEIGVDTEFVFAPSNYSYIGASGIYTTLEDFTKWAINFNKPKVGSAEIFNKMNTKGRLNNGEESFYALGQVVQEYNGLQRIWHSGSDAGYRSYIGRFPAQGMTFILLSNNATVHAEGEALKVANLFLEPFFKQVQESEKEETLNLKIVDLSFREKKEFTGAYLSRNYEITRHVKIENDTLMYIRPDQGNRKSKLHPIAESKFVLGTNSNVHVSFPSKEELNILVDNKVDETYYRCVPKSYTSEELHEFTGRFYAEELETFYELQVKNNKLVIFNTRIDDIELNPLKEDVFLSTSWIFNSMVFERNVDNTIKGFRVSGQRVKNMYFKKL